MKTLDDLTRDALETVQSGYYRDLDYEISSTSNSRLSEAIMQKRGKAVICEVKFASPSQGEIRRSGVAAEIAREMEAGGACALSVLTEPKNFRGSVSNFTSIRRATSLPLIMKDIVVSKEQIAAARDIGANAILLIEEIFTSRQTKGGLSLNDALAEARDLGLDSIVETHTEQGLEIVARAECDIIGLNNRDLNTFVTSIETTVELLERFSRGHLKDRSLRPLIMSESGYESPNDITRIKARLDASGSLSPDAFLIGTSIMKSGNIREKVQSFAEVLQ